MSKLLIKNYKSQLNFKIFKIKFWNLFPVFFAVFFIWSLGSGPVKALTFDELASFGKPPAAVTNILPVEVSSKSFVVLNQQTGEILLEENSAAQRVPASLTKLTTVLVALDTVADWNAACTLNSTDQVGGVRLTFSRGYTYRLKDLLQATLIPSYNDAAHALARCSGIGMEQFIIRMNEKVKQLGAWNTSFVEPSGLSARNFTTALDMAKISNAAFSTENIRDVASKKSGKICTIKPTQKCQTLKSTNELLGDKDLFILAGKTGFLEESGYNFVSSIKGDFGKFYIVVVLGSSSKLSRFGDTKKLVQNVQSRALFGL